MMRGQEHKISLDSLWAIPPADAELLPAEGLWPQSRNPGRGGQIYHCAWLGPSERSQLQKFIERLVGALRYQTIELFLSEPSTAAQPDGPLKLIAAAYRKSDLRGSPTGRNGIPKGVYNIREQNLSPLRSVLLGGEPFEVVEERLQRYQDLEVSDPIGLRSFIDYSFVATLIAQLAGLLPYPRSNDLSLFWDIALRVGKSWLPIALDQGQAIPSVHVRAALKLLIQINGGDILLEEGTQENLITLAQEQISITLDDAPRQEQFSQAYELLAALSSHVEEIGNQLRREVSKLPISLVRQLFEAQISAYPDALRSVTTDARSAIGPATVGDLRKLIVHTNSIRNKRVNIVVTEGYERAASWVLDIGDKKPPKIHNMTMFAYEIVDAVSGTKVTALVRGMNRFCVNSKQKLEPYAYDAENGDGIRGKSLWRSTDEEKELYDILRKQLRTNLPVLMQQTRLQLVEKSTVEAANVNAFSATPADEWDKAGLVGSSPAMNELRDRVIKFARYDRMSVLITGEMGTGKDLVARALHAHSERGKNGKPFFAQNCANPEPDKIEGELFGVHANSFSGVNAAPGKLVLANGGTLFLDEIGDFPLQCQGKLLRVLQDLVVEPVGSGGRAQTRLDLRILYATNRDLEELCDTGKLRRDFLQRIDQLRIQVPPLRERLRDLPELVQHILQRLSSEAQVPLPIVSGDTFELFNKYHWPGNVRELENVLRRALVICTPGSIRPRDLESPFDHGETI